MASTDDGQIASTLPVAWEVMTVAAYLIPAVPHPVIAVALTDPAAGNPDVRTVSPLPIARRPDIACTRRRNDLDARRRGLAVVTVAYIVIFFSALLT